MRHHCLLAVMKGLSSRHARKAPTMRNKTRRRSRGRSIAREAAQTIVVAGTLVLGATVLAPTATAEDTCSINGSAPVPDDRGDFDGDGMINHAECTQFTTDPTRADSDWDGLTDPQEVHTYNTQPGLPDTDGDGMGDRYEVDAGLNPLVNDNAAPAAPPPQAPAQAPAPAPAPPRTFCIPDPFNLNFPGAC